MSDDSQVMQALRARIAVEGEDFLVRLLAGGEQSSSSSGAIPPVLPEFSRAAGGRRRSERRARPPVRLSPSPSPFPRTMTAAAYQDVEGSRRAGSGRSALVRPGPGSQHQAAAVSEAPPPGFARKGRGAAVDSSSLAPSVSGVSAERTQPAAPSVVVMGSKQAKQVPTARVNPPLTPPPSQPQQSMLSGAVGEQADILVGSRRHSACSCSRSSSWSSGRRSRHRSAGHHEHRGRRHSRESACSGRSDRSRSARWCSPASSESSCSSDGSGRYSNRPRRAGGSSRPSVRRSHGVSPTRAMASPVPVVTPPPPSYPPPPPPAAVGEFAFSDAWGAGEVGEIVRTCGCVL